jgi:hypothetical protein
MLCSKPEGKRADSDTGCWLTPLRQCSEGRPCGACQAQFENNRGNVPGSWTACVSSSLPDLNIFALGKRFPSVFEPKRLIRLGVSIFESSDSNASSACPTQQLDLSTCLSLYNHLFRDEVCFHIMGPVDSLYIKVLRHTYGPQASEVHPFILEESNPLHILVELNVILLGSPVVAADMIGCVRYLQKLRGICAVVAFECLGKALRRTTLAASDIYRQSALIVQLALLLDQVVETKENLPAAKLVCARGEVFKEMRQHLIQYLLYYLHKLMPGTHRSHKPLIDCIRDAESEGHLDNAFWTALSRLLPGCSVQKPPMLRKYADLSWDEPEDESGQALHEHFASHCSISCR